MSKLVDKLLKEKQNELSSWCNSATISPSEDKDSIIASLAKEINPIERMVELGKVSRGLNPKIIKQLVDQYFKEYHGLDEEDNFIGKEKTNANN